MDRFATPPAVGHNKMHYPYRLPPTVSSPPVSIDTSLLENPLVVRGPFSTPWLRLAPLFIIIDDVWAKVVYSSKEVVMVS